jgi:pyruvate,water dikinase
MDVEWAKDGETGQISIVQARPETVQSRQQAAALKTYTLKRKGRRIMKRAAAIVTDHGGRTSHAAIVSARWGYQRSSAPAKRPRS